MYTRQNVLDIVGDIQWSQLSDHYGIWCKVIPLLGTLDRDRYQRIMVLTDFDVHTPPSSIIVKAYPDIPFDFPRIYYSNGGLGGLLGLLAKQQGMILRPDGMYAYFIHRNRRFIKQVPWNEDEYGLVSGFLGNFLDVDPPDNEGFSFETEEAMFKAVAASELFLYDEYVHYRGRLPIFDRFLDYALRNALLGNKKNFQFTRLRWKDSWLPSTLYTWYVDQVQELEYNYKRALLRKQYNRVFLKEMKQHAWWETMLATADMETVYRHAAVEYSYRSETDTVVQ